MAVGVLFGLLACPGCKQGATRQDGLKQGERSATIDGDAKTTDKDTQPARRSTYTMEVTKEPFGTNQDGKAVDIYTLTNDHGMRARIMTRGGTIVSLEVPDREGKLGDVVLGFNTLEEYIKDSPHFGCVCGRYANRIGGASFTLDGTTYKLVANKGDNQLHGGKVGFDKYVWPAEPVERDDAVGVRMTHVSPDGDQGYPGTLSCTMTYWLTNENELRIDYEATTDKPTVLNLTNHSYFNLAGEGNGTVLDHVLRIDADHFTPTDAEQIPTGEIRSVKGTPMDFTTPTPIGARVEQDDEQLRLGNGYDHNWVLNSGGGELALAAEVTEPTTGRVMRVLTTEPGVQLYIGNYLNGRLTGKSGKTYVRRGALCLETQHFPDSPNHDNFPSTVLRPGETFTSTTVFAFGVE